MENRELVGQFEKNIRIMHALADRLDKSGKERYSQHEMGVLMKLHLNGRARLKDIAERFGVSSSALCLTFGKMEKAGLILREVDSKDKRNTYYSLTRTGTATAKRMIEKFRDKLAKIFEPLSKGDEAKMLAALKTINDVLEKQL
ncbi:MAG: MarR family transcriptional regulator [Rickettsiales bacterium]|jgi:DNA-binding MarR family transcriptional regulator|nr:MarR family transcriptional regulator [Rickettsiales bacterium]